MLRQISEFIAKNRARNNISNRNEFLRKRQSADAIVPLDNLTSMDVDIPSCARIDAIPVNRDIQMKYDVAKNDGGPLMRTIKVEQGDEGSQALKDQSKLFVDSIGERIPTLQLHPG
ncbi:MAG TPA: hypothetical protein VGO47_00420, partial [Chlamydiales bacterium]|nr:hypothetical protein [Chlamydiales bacterium]